MRSDAIYIFIDVINICPVHSVVFAANLLIHLELIFVPSICNGRSFWLAQVLNQWNRTMPWHMNKKWKPAQVLEIFSKVSESETGVRNVKGIVKTPEHRLDMLHRGWVFLPWSSETLWQMNWKASIYVFYFIKPTFLYSITPVLAQTKAIYGCRQ